MPYFLHNFISLVMGLMVLAAPALCLCAEKPAPKQQAHQCCASKEATPTDASDQDHSAACTHCGAQTVRLALEHSPSLEMILPVALLPLDVGVDLVLQTQSQAACMAASQNPPGNPTPVQSHTISLT